MFFLIHYLTPRNSLLFASKMKLFFWIHCLRPRDFTLFWIKNANLFHSFLDQKCKFISEKVFVKKVFATAIHVFFSVFCKLQSTCHFANCGVQHFTLSRLEKAADMVSLLKILRNRSDGQRPNHFHIWPSISHTGNSQQFAENFL